MNTRLIFFIFFVVSSRTFAQSLSVIPISNKSSIADSLIGYGFSVQNFTYTGDSSAVGYFTDNTNSFGIRKGFILTTGIISGANGPQGPNNTTQAGTSNYYPGDSLLSSINGDVTNDAAIIEFDFIPVVDTIKLHYVFGSEEYPEFACGALNINDILGIFISGPNPSGGNYVKQNTSLIPDTTLPVSIKTINNKGCTPYSNYYVDNSTGKVLQFDGYTTPFYTHIAVTKSVKYHIKIAIADVLDGIYDSGIFLESNSFLSTGSHERTTIQNPLSIIYTEQAGVYLLSCPLESNEASDIVVMNSLGQIVYVKQNRGSIYEELNLSGYAQGFYYVSINNGTCNFSKKLFR